MSSRFPKDRVNEIRSRLGPRCDYFTAEAILARMVRDGLDPDAVDFDVARDALSDLATDGNVLDTACEALRLRIQGEDDEYDALVEQEQDRQAELTRFVKVRSPFALRINNPQLLRDLNRDARFWDALATVLRVHTAHPELTRRKALHHAFLLDRALQTDRNRYARVREVLSQGWDHAEALMASRMPSPRAHAAKECPARFHHPTACRAYERIRPGVVVYPHGRGLGNGPRRVSVASAALEVKVRTVPCKSWPDVWPSFYPEDYAIMRRQAGLARNR